MKIINYKDIDKDFFSKIEFENIESVNEVISKVKTFGDNAVREYTKKFGDGDIENFKVSEKEIEEAIKSVNSQTKETLQYAIKNVGEFAKAQLNSIKDYQFYTC